MRKAVVLGLVVLALAGCSLAPRGAEPEPAPLAPTDRAGAPTVAAPRELSSRATDPCRTLLSPTQVRRLGYELPGEFRVSLVGSPTCIWRERDTRRSAIVAVALTQDLFVNTYRNRFLPIFRPVEIAGLPAVDIMTSPRALTCTTTVGVADSQSLDIQAGVSGGINGQPDGDPCAECHRVAEAIVSTLPPK